MKDKAVFSVVLGSYNRKKYLKKTIDNVRQELEQLPISSEIIVIDGGSNDGALSWLIKQKDIITIAQHNRGKCKDEIIAQRSWGYFMNLGFKCAQGKYICMLSDDCLLQPGSLRNAYFEYEDLLGKGKKIGALAFHWRNWPSYRRYFVIKVKGQVYLNHGIYLKSGLDEIGYINEEDYYFYCADTDLCFKLVQAGYSIESTTKALVEHSQHISVKIRKENKGKGKSRLNHDEQALQNNWKDFFGNERYQDVVEYVENHEIIPDNSLAEREFGRAYRIQLLKGKIFSFIKSIMH